MYKFKLVLPINYLLRSPTFVFILMFYFGSLLLGAITTFLPEPNIPESIPDDDIILNLVIAAIAAPLIETILFQTLIIEGVCLVIKKPSNNFCTALILSSVAFALNHTYSLAYFIITFLAGIILALAYYLGRYRKENAFVLVFIIHSMYNLTVLIYNQFYLAL